ncbi:MAG: OmpA family protein [Candidatus Kapaibacteriota bacterium]
MNNYRLVYILFLFLFIIGKLYSEIPKGYDEAVFSFRYNIFSIEKIVYFSFETQELYLPVTEYLDFLTIYYKSDDGETYTGYVNNPDSSYTIDFKSKIFNSYYTKKAKIPDEWWFNKDGQIYCNIKLFDSVFHSETRLNVLDLSAYIKSEIVFPVERNYRASRSLNADNSITSDEEVPDYQIIETNSFRLLNGGIIDYNLSGTKSGYMTSSTFSLNFGLELLGGAFQIQTLGNYNSNIRRVETYNKFAWKYNFEDNKYISTVNLGEQFTTIDLNQPTTWIRGSSALIYGFEINNRPLLMPRQYEKRLITRNLGKFWKSEIKIDESKTLMLQTDDNGVLSFLLPIRYGITRYNAKCYGPNGEFDQFGEEIYIPTQMLKTFQVQYDLTGGIDRTDNTKVINGNFQLGLTSWQTVNFSIFQRENHRAELFFGNLTKIVGNIILGLSYSPENMVGSSLNFSTRGGENFSIGYTNFLKKSNFNTTDVTDRIDLQGSFNRFFDLPFSTNFTSSYLQSKTYKNITFSPTFYTYYKNFSLMTKYLLYYSISNNNTNRRDGFEFSLNYYSGLGEIFGFDNRVRFDLRTNYDIPSQKFGSVSLMINDDLGRGLQISGNITREISTGRLSGGISITLYNDILQYRGYGSYSDNQAASYSSSVSGSMNIDLTTPTVYMSNSMGGSGRGKGGANIRFYQDLNNNGNYDPDEPIMKGVKISTPGKFTQSRQSEGMIILYNLTPGDKYSVRVAKESFSNPYIRPQISEFSFFPQPNVFTKIDIPCFSTGILEGRIIKKEKREVVGQGGLKLHLTSIDSSYSTTFEVFSDGSFYTMGIPIGKYILNVDTIQLKLLKSTTEPKQIELEVKPTSEGDYIGQLEFALNSLIPKTEVDNEIMLESEESLAASKASSSNSNKKQQIIKTEPPKNPQNEQNQDIQKNESPRNLTQNIIDVSPDEKAILDTLERQDKELEKYTNKPQDQLILYFSKSRDTYLSNNNTKELNKILKLLKDNPKLLLIIEGHSDSFSTILENFEISSKRTNEVASYLVKQGIKRERLILHPKGSMQPLNNNKTEEGSRRNRSVVLKLIES